MIDAEAFDNLRAHLRAAATREASCSPGACRAAAAPPHLLAPHAFELDVASPT